MPTSDELYAQAEKLKDGGKLEEAVAVLTQLVNQDPNYALAHSCLAVVLGKLRRHDEAIRHGLKVCELEPNDPFSFTAMSVTFQRTEKFPKPKTRWPERGCCKAGISVAEQRGSQHAASLQPDSAVVDRVVDDLVGAGAAAVLGDQQAAGEFVAAALFAHVDQRVGGGQYVAVD